MSSLINTQGIGGVVFAVLVGGCTLAYLRMLRWVIGQDGDSGDREQ